MQNNHIFRKEALEARRTKLSAYGEIIFKSPFYHRVIALLAVICAISLCLILLLGTYTRRITVTGNLILEDGLTQVVAPQTGVLINSFVNNGDTVKEGTVMFTMTSDRQGRNSEDIQASIIGSTERKRQSITQAIDYTKKLEEKDNSSKQQRLEKMQADVNSMDEQKSLLQQKVYLAEETVKRYHKLVEADLITKEQLQQKEDDLIEQRIRLKGLEHDRISIVENIMQLQSDLASLPLKTRSTVAELERNLEGLNQDLVESDAKRFAKIVSPINGMVTTIRAQPGQSVLQNSILVSIIPRNSTLQAYLYVPSRAIGFIRPNATVLLRYQAFPYQKFGLSRGRIINIAATTMDINDAVSVKGVTNETEPVYRVIVAIDHQFIEAYGKQTPLRPGMILEADILLDHRHLYEWIVEPLSMLSGKV